MGNRDKILINAIFFILQYNSIVYTGYNNIKYNNNLVKII